MNATAGGRVSTLLKDTPAAVSVMTRDFLDDIAANNFVEAVEWSVNVVGAHAEPLEWCADGDAVTVNFPTVADSPAYVLKFETGG